MPRKTIRIGGMAGLAIAMGWLAGCTNSGLEYPSVSNISDLGKVLTPQEREKAVNDLTLEQKNHGDNAAKDAAKQP